MISPAWRFFLLLAVFGLCSGCALWPFGKKPLAAPSGALGHYCGTISNVNPNSHFVVIDAGGFSFPAAGTELLVRRAGQEVARLRAGSEVRRPFAIADILQGNPQNGDDVWLTN